MGHMVRSHCLPARQKKPALGAAAANAAFGSQAGLEAVRSAVLQALDSTAKGRHSCATASTLALIWNVSRKYSSLALHDQTCMGKDVGGEWPSMLPICAGSSTTCWLQRWVARSRHACMSASGTGYAHTRSSSSSTTSSAHQQQPHRRMRDSVYW